MNDNVDGEDLEIRRAAVEALGPYNGSVVVVDPTTGRILTIVNQKLALQSGFTPCSTIKLVAAMAAMTEGVMEPHTPVFLTRRTSLDLTQALAHSNNPYFATLGRNWASSGFRITPSCSVWVKRLRSIWMPSSRASCPHRTRRKAWA